MKKILACALCACFTAAASAVSVNWSSPVSVTGGASGSLPEGMDPHGFSLALVLDLSAQPTDGFSLMTLGFGGNAYGVTLGTNATGTARVAVGSTNPNVSSPVLTAGTHVIGIFVDTSTSVERFKVSIDGGAYTNLSYSSRTYGDFTWTAFSAAYSLPSFIDEASLYFADGEVTPEDFALLPEPGALAVLALGVAGLTLRRRPQPLR